MLARTSHPRSPALAKSARSEPFRRSCYWPVAGRNADTFCRTIVSKCCGATGDSGREAYTAIAWGVGLSHERSYVAGAESFYSLEGNMCGTVRQGMRPSAEAVVAESVERRAGAKGNTGKGAGAYTAERRDVALDPGRATAPGFIATMTRSDFSASFCGSSKWRSPCFASQAGHTSCSSSTSSLRCRRRPPFPAPDGARSACSRCCARCC